LPRPGDRIRAPLTSRIARSQSSPASLDIRGRRNPLRAFGADDALSSKTRDHMGLPLKGHTCGVCKEFDDDES
jgi:hypothetical protein